MIVRERMVNEYHHAHFLVCDHDHSRPRIVNGWSLLERILNINYRIGEARMHQVWLWNTKLGELHRLNRRTLSESADSDTHTQTFGLFKHDGTLVGQLDVQTVAEPDPTRTKS